MPQIWYRERMIAARVARFVAARILQVGLSGYIAGLILFSRVGSNGHPIVVEQAVGRSLNKHRFGRFGESSESRSVCLRCSNHSPRGILMHPMEDLCLGFLLARLLGPGSFF